VKVDAGASRAVLVAARGKTLTKEEMNGALSRSPYRVTTLAPKR
jgi:hypothetical protein